MSWNFLPPGWLPRRILLCGLLAAGATGCGIFTSYPDQTAEARRAFARGDGSKALKELADGAAGGNDRLCYLLERGLILHTLGDLGASTAEFFKARDLIREYEERATVSGSEILEQTGTLLVNEKTSPYQGEGFEKILLHTYLALNFLAAGKLDDARVEIRATYDRQREEAGRHEKALAAAKEKAEQEAIPIDLVSSRMAGEYSSSAAIAGRIQNCYQNALACYLSSLVYELNGEANDAYIDLKAFAELVPDFPPAQKKLLYFAEQLGFQDELADWRRRFRVPEVRKRSRTTHGELVLVLQTGEAPLKSQVLIPLPLAGGIVTIAFPIYEPRPDSFSGAEVLLDEKVVGRTAVLYDVEAVAVRYLKDQALTLALKQLGRAGIKTAATYIAERQAGKLGVLAMSLWNVVSEQADRRSWTTLPRTIQLLDAALPAGRYRATVNFLGGGPSPLSLPITISPGRKTFLNVRAFGTHAYYRTFSPRGTKN